MYNPTLPVNNSPLSSTEMRSQLTSLKALIDAIVTLTAAEVDSVSTGSPGDPATVGLSVIGNTLHFTFSIPRGDTGAPGEAGQPGTQGEPGTPGAPGEVTLMQLQDAILTASANSNGVGTLDAPFGDADMESLRNKLNELINALRRNP